MQYPGDKNTGHQFPATRRDPGAAVSYPASVDDAAIRAALVAKEQMRSIVADREARIKEADARMEQYAEQIQRLQRDLVSVRDMNQQLDAGINRLTRENEVLRAHVARQKAERSGEVRTKTAEAIDAAIQNIHGRFGLAAKARIDQLDAAISHFVVTECLAFAKDLEQAIERVGVEHLHGMDRLIASQPVVDDAPSGKVMRL